MKWWLVVIVVVLLIVLLLLFCKAKGEYFIDDSQDTWYRNKYLGGKGNVYQGDKYPKWYTHKDWDPYVYDYYYYYPLMMPIKHQNF